MIRKLLIIPTLLLTVGTATAMSAPVQQDTINNAVDSLFIIDLDDLVVTAKKNIVKSDGAKVTYNMKEDDSSKGQSLLEALRKVPMVSVDAQDNIRINGSENFKIYVNGREDTMLESNYQRMFKAMPAESVINIEVITEPGAKYDAEGVGGILNLITEQTAKRNDGYSGSLTGALGLRNAYLNAGITGKADKFTIGANVTVGNNGLRKQENKNSSYIEYLDSDENHLLLSDVEQAFKYKMVQTDLNMSWEPNSRNLFTCGGSFIYLSGGLDKYLASNRMYDVGNVLKWSYNNSLMADIYDTGATANASYRLSFNDDNTHRLIIGYLFNFGRQIFNFDTEFTEANNYQYQYPRQMSETSTYRREHTVQIDYSNPFAEGKHTLDLGVKGVFRHNMAGQVTAYGNDAESMIHDIYDLNTFQDENILAAYTSYSGNFTENVSLTAGLRYEHTMRKLAFDKKPEDNFSTHLNDWVPNAALTYMFAPAHNLRLAYQMRISRPNISQINPAPAEILDYIVQKGNPNLSSEHSNIISLTYTNFGRVLGGNISLQHNIVNNCIVNYAYNEGMKVINTFANIGRKNMTTLRGYLNYNITSNMSVGLNGSVSYTDLRADSGIGNHGWSGDYSANWNWRGPVGLRFSAYGGQSVHNITFQGYSTGWYYYGLSISRNFLKNDALSVTISASDFFQAYNGGKWVNITDTMKEVERYSTRSTNVSLSVTWKFGHLKEQVRKTGLDIINDDASTTKSQGGIGL